MGRPHFNAENSNVKKRREFFLKKKTEGEKVKGKEMEGRHQRQVGY